MASKPYDFSQHSEQEGTRADRRVEDGDGGEPHVKLLRPSADVGGGMEFPKSGQWFLLGDKRSQYRLRQLIARKPRHDCLSTHELHNRARRVVGALLLSFVVGQKRLE